MAVEDALGLTTTSSVNVRIVQTATDLRVNPATVSLAVGGTQAFGAILLDQFGVAMASQPPSFTWSTNGGGSINGSGLFSATTAGGPYVVTGTSGSFSDTASVTVNPAESVSVAVQVLSVPDQIQPVV